MSSNNESFPNVNDNHLEIFSLLWLDTNNNMKDRQDTEVKLRSIINHFKKFQDAKECQQYIEQRSKQDRLVLVVSNKLSQEMVSSIHKLRQVLSIYVYCEEGKTDEQWCSKFSKVKAVAVDINELVSRMKVDVKICMKEEEPLSMNMLSTGQSARVIDGQFVFSQVLIDCLLRLKSNDLDREELISSLKTEYKGNSSELSKIEEFEKDYTSNKALWWYTYDSFFYRILNAALRKQDIRMILLCRSFISDIHRQLQYLQSKKPMRVYRSQLMSIDELRYLEKYIGQFISMNSFLSTSNERPVALFYMGDQSQKIALERVLFEIEADPEIVSSKPFADINMYSCFTNESEVLFMLGSIFRLNNITHTDNQVWIVHMTLCSDDEHDLKSVLTDMKHQNGIGETSFHTLGKLLWTMGKPDLAEKYYNRLVDEISPEDPLLNVLYAELSKIASQQGHYNKSVQLHQKSLESRNQSPQTNITNKVFQVESLADLDTGIVQKLIYQTATTLKRTVEQVKANVNQCKRLEERIDTITSVLQHINYTGFQKSELKKSLMNFCICIEQCLAFVTKFQGEMWWFLKVFNSQNSKSQFENLNAQILQCATDLNLEINLQQIFDHKQDELDQRNDMKAIEYKIDEIASKMEQHQQQELHHFQSIKNNTKQRYKSYKHHLEQNIIEANDPGIATTAVDKKHFVLCIPYYDLLQEEYIGQGGFADVYRGRWLSQDKEVAIKVIRIQYLSENVKEDCMKEISTMNQIHHEHILSMYGACIEPEKYALVVEYMNLGSLHNVLKRETTQLKWLDRWSIALQMTKGINYLHTLPKPIIHRDIKSHNVLLANNARGFLVKIGDFGLAKIRHETSKQSTHEPVVGTLPWKAPELLKMGRHTEASDVYALGIVLWEVATRCEPYEDADESTIRTFVKDGDRLDIPANVPEYFAELITQSWAQDPKERPTCQKLLYVFEQQCSELITIDEVTVNENDLDQSTASINEELEFSQQNSVEDETSMINLIQPSTGQNFYGFS
ncbi:unnamed protein product [Rotaria socialis]|uniref:Protein kinase domain-containing protein n=1 Tax=Rotaria socialis TaxID=392032 RepID=A0A818YK61_9BILA|nr:unnamed protein product [Rotaria socialis]CAF4635559.1 unnamed protein product [Rotaria socialis]CAF4749654.1 unnamed protein product [Rotaria socialis]